MIFFMWKNALWRHDKLFTSKANIPLIFKIDCKQLAFAFKVMFALRGADPKAPLYNLPIFMQNFNNLFFLAFDFLFKFLETNYTQVLLFILLLLAYFVIISFFIKIKFNKKSTSLYELMIFGLLHTKLLVITATFIYSFNKLYEYITPLIYNNKLYPLSKYITLACDFAEQNPGWGELLSIVIIAQFLSVIITLLVVKTNKNNLKLFFTFVISSLLLRGILLWIMNLLPWESQAAQIGIELLTARLIFFDFFKEHFLNLGYFVLERLDICFKTVLNFSVTPLLCDETGTTNEDWHAYKKQVWYRANNRDKLTTTIAEYSNTEVLHMMRNLQVKNQLLNMKLTPNEINSIEFVYQRSWLLEDSVVLVRRPEDNAIFPIRFIYLLPDFINPKTQPATAKFVPFPFSREKWTIPLFKHESSLDSFDVVVYQTRNRLSDFRSYSMFSWVQYVKPNLASSFAKENCSQYHSFYNQHSIKPAVVHDWNSQNVVFIDMGYGHYIKYNPYYITDAMVEKPIVIKMSNGVYEPTKANVSRLYRQNEVGWSNSIYSYTWGIAKGYMDNNPTVSFKDALKVAHTIQRSSILQQIKFNEVNWS